MKLLNYFDYQDNVYAYGGLEERSHIPVQPLWVALIRVGQVVRHTTHYQYQSFLKKERKEKTKKKNQFSLTV